MLNKKQDKIRVYKDKQTRLWHCQSGVVAGVGTTQSGAYQNMKNRLQCPFVQHQLQQVLG